MLTILLAALPSQNRGILALKWVPLSSLLLAPIILSLSVLTSTFVPCSTVIGLSVLSLMVMHGIPKTVVSSWMPPESVNTNLEFDIKARKSR